MKALIRLIFLSAALSLIAAAACDRSREVYEKYDSSGNNTEDDPVSNRITVVTTIAPLYSFTKNIAGDAALVENILPSGAGLHEYSPTPEDVIKISKARVIIKNGLGLEPWLDKLVQNETEHEQPAGIGKKIIVDASEGVDIIPGDPHIWLSPRNVLILVNNIEKALMKADHVNAKTYAKNAEAYIKRLEGLDNEIRAGTASFKMKDFVSLHPAFRYFARDYGLRQAAVIKEFPEQEPSAQHIADVIRTIRAKNIKAIFSDTGGSHKIVDSLAKDLKLQIYNLDPLETGALYPEWYEVRMRANLEVLKTVMSQ